MDRSDVSSSSPLLNPAANDTFGKALGGYGSPPSPASNENRGESIPGPKYGCLEEPTSRLEQLAPPALSWVSDMVTNVQAETRTEPRANALGRRETALSNQSWQGSLGPKSNLWL